MEVRRLAARKEEIYRELLGDRTPLVPSGLQKLMDTLNTHKVGHAHPCLRAIVRGGGGGGGTQTPTRRRQDVQAPSIFWSTNDWEQRPARQQRALQVQRHAE